MIYYKSVSLRLSIFQGNEIYSLVKKISINKNVRIVAVIYFIINYTYNKFSTMFAHLYFKKAEFFAGGIFIIEMPNLLSVRFILKISYSNTYKLF